MTLEKPHIRLLTNGNQIILQVDTWELKDFIEDYLLEECDIDYEYFQDINPEMKITNEESYNLYFSEEYTSDQIISAIEKLNDKEIIEIVDFQRKQANERKTDSIKLNEL